MQKDVLSFELSIHQRLMEKILSTTTVLNCDNHEEYAKLFPNHGSGYILPNLECGTSI